MVARVQIKANDLESVLKVSLPGADVRVANLSQLAFDARFSCLEVFRRGSVSLPTGGPGTDGTGPWHTFPYGETLVSPPLGFFLFNNGVSAGGGSPFIYINDTSGGSYSQNTRRVILTTTYMQARWDQFPQTAMFYILFRPLIA